MKFNLIYGLLVVFCSIQISAQDKKLELIDKVYEQNIRTSRLYPRLNQATEVVQSAVADLQVGNLILDFDVLYQDYEELRVKIVPCNWDWSISTINEIDFLYEYNEFDITEYEYSFKTRTPYIHYFFEVPRVKKSGNYVLKVYRADDEDDLLITKRFVITSSQSQIAAEVGFSVSPKLSRTHQQINLSLRYDAARILNPWESIKVVIRKNQRWDETRFDLKPTFVREDLGEIEYDRFDLTNNFPGGNEFRFFDIRSVYYRGQNVAAIETLQEDVSAILNKDINRSKLAYGQYDDLNGQYVINNLDQGSADSESDYVNVAFFLEAAEEKEGVYVSGAFNDWSKDGSNRMNYDAELGGYYLQYMLKQGWYNFEYAAAESGPAPFEGNHFNTENQYEIIIYHTPFGSRHDEVIGYSSIRNNYRGF